jgi:hypothetical protein
VMELIRYPTHPKKEVDAVFNGFQGRMSVRCGAPMIPPECAGAWVRQEVATWPTSCLVCAPCGVVSATAEQGQQARAAARADGTWPAAELPWEAAP